MSRRLAKALAAATAAALMSAGSALAANTGTVGVSVAGPSTTIHISVPQTNAPTAVVDILVPPGYTANLSQAAGTTIGSIPSATAYSFDTQLTLPLTGSVLVSSLAAVSSGSATAAETVAACTQGATPTAVWLLDLSVAGQALKVPLYVFRDPAGLSSLASYELRVCLAPPDVPASNPLKAPQGAELLDADFTTTGVFTASGASPWETLITPYVPTQGTLDPAATFEARSVVGSGSVTLKAKLNKKTHVVTLTGTVGGAGSGAVTIYRGATAVATANASGGSFRATLKLAGKKAASYTARIKGAESQTACTPPLPATVAPAGCASATVGAFAATSNKVTVKP